MVIAAEECQNERDSAKIKGEILPYCLQQNL